MDKIKNDPTFKKIIKESFGGIMFDESNLKNYDTIELLSMWDDLSDSEKDASGGIVKGVFDFIK